MEAMAIPQLLILPPETREDRTKRLFRHYTVGSYDSLTSHRYWQVGQGMDTQGHLWGLQVWGGTSGEREGQGVRRLEEGEDRVPGHLCLLKPRLA